MGEETKARHRHLCMWRGDAGDKEARASRCRRGTRWVRERWGRGGGEVPLLSLSALARCSYFRGGGVWRDDTSRRRW